MHSNPLLPHSALLAVLMVVAQSSQAATTVTLISEKFSTAGTAAGDTWSNAGLNWKFTSPDSTATGITTEMWIGTGGASARGLTTTYDHDNNGGTAAINIPGGFEVMSAFTGGSLPDTIRCSVTLTLPSDLDTSLAGMFSFFTENRISSGYGGNAPCYGIRNVTDNRDIIALTGPNQPTGSWNYQNPAVNFITADKGDTIEVYFQETISGGDGGGARGLEIADVKFSVTTVPEPSVAMIGGLGLLGMWRRRR